MENKKMDLQEKNSFDPSRCFKSHVLSKSPKNPVKMIVNVYRDAILFVITQKNKFGSFIEVQRSGGEIDVKLLNGAGKRNEKYQEIVRTLSEMLLSNPQKILGLANYSLVELFEAKVQTKSIFFNICFDFASINEEGELQSEDEEAEILELYGEWKKYWSVESNFEILCS